MKMSDEKIKEIWDIINMQKVSLYAERWLESGGDGEHEALLAQNEYLLHKIQTFCFNNLGLPETKEI